MIATIVGIVVAVLIVGALEALGHYFYPPPASLQNIDPGQMAKLIDRLPFASLLFVVASWLLGSAGGAATATRVAAQKTVTPALVVGLAMTGVILYILDIIPHPVWMQIVGVALPLPVAWIAATAVRR